MSAPDGRQLNHFWKHSCYTWEIDVGLADVATAMPASVASDPIEEATSGVIDSGHGGQNDNSVFDRHLVGAVSARIKQFWVRSSSLF